jgi:hypothetical protein
MTAQGAGLSAHVAAEIRLLRKGRGVQASGLEARLGPLLRELAGSPHPGEVAALRHSLIAELNSCSAPLPEDLRTAVAASLALTARTRQMPYFGDRVTWLAGHLSRDYRTALRRIDAAEQLLAEEVARELLRRRGRTADTPGGWYLEEFRALLRLDTATPESIEHRRIVSTRADLKEVMAWLDVPHDPGQPGPDLQAEIMYGGRLIRKEQPARNRFHLMVELPAPLQPGQQHEYGLIVRMREGIPMRPHYILTPECQCNHFVLRVRFDTERLPVWARRVDGETVRMFEAAQPAGRMAVPDATGEVEEEFRNLTMYLGYGLQWQPAA